MVVHINNRKWAEYIQIYEVVIVYPPRMRDMSLRSDEKYLFFYFLSPPFGVEEGDEDTERLRCSDRFLLRGMICSYAILYKFRFE